MRGNCIAIDEARKKKNSYLQNFFNYFLVCHVAYDSGVVAWLIYVIPATAGIQKMTVTPWLDHGVQLKILKFSIFKLYFWIPRSSRGMTTVDSRLRGNDIEPVF
ncbi:MAG: hypothetical protein ACEY3D_04650 [Rickettsia sp.]|uniref:hypothetical protein n=1 Tax=Rickettsia sp. TaxID=789 RepID=UPI00397C4D8E